MRGKVIGALATGLSIVGSLLFAAVMDFAGWDPYDSASGWIWWIGALFALLFMGGYIGMQLGMRYSKKYEVTRPKGWLVSALLTACILFGIGAGGQALFAISFEKGEEYKGTDVVLLLDASSSMDAYGYSNARTAAGTQFVDGLDATCQLATISFSSTVIDHSDMMIMDSMNKNTIKQVIIGIDSVGGTNFEDAFYSAETLLCGYGREECGKAVILLTDGEVERYNNVSDATKQKYIDGEIKVFTIRISSSSQLLSETEKLIDFANETGGFDVQLWPDANGTVSADEMLEAFRNAFVASTEEEYDADENLLIVSRETTVWQWFVRMAAFALASIVAGFGYFGKRKVAGLVTDAVVGLVLAVFVSTLSWGRSELAIYAIALCMSAYVVYRVTEGEEIDV